MRNTHGTIYVGIDVSKDKLAVAIAGGERGDEVLSLGTFENTPASVDKLLKKLSGRGDISACYEAGPTGYGLYRQVRAAGCPGKLLSPSRRRACVEHVRQTLGISERRACRVLGQHRSTQRKPPLGREDGKRCPDPTFPVSA